jgi:UDP-glucose 4-epimerase
MANNFGKLLITGGTGYLGSQLLNDPEFRSLFTEITCVGRSPKEERIKNKSKICFHKIDISIKVPELKLIKEADFVIHTAHIRNIDAEKEFLSTLKNKKLVFFSTAAVYGESKNDKPHRVSDDCNPINDYGFYKLEIEEYIKENFKDFIIIRISNVYGGEDSARYVQQIFRDHIKQGKSIIINSNKANQILRDFIPVDDYVNKLKTLIKKNQNGIFNLSSGKGVSLEDLISEIAIEEGKSIDQIEIIYKGTRDSEIQRSILECNSLDLI